MLRTQLITPLPRALSGARHILIHPLFHRLFFVWSHWIVLSPSSGTYF